MWYRKHLKTNKQLIVTVETISVSSVLSIVLDKELRLMEDPKSNLVLLNVQIKHI